MIAIPIPRNKSKWNTISFVSTLYLCPILDLLLAHIPHQLQAEIRLGLQEALVNAAKHGNKLDPTKTIIVKFTITDAQYCWVIIDQGSGFIPKYSCPSDAESYLPPEEAESGRGLCILQEVFDQVNWNKEGTELTLSKQMRHNYR
ncbi:MAG: anti-sigma regulatory factor [Xenococcaceae cyanobacterium MO_167.B52]|nr:anti-sigma regulatory factor [Xenococcaceae cyanobacterium MO_167.B52]